MFAVQSGHADCTKELLERGAEKAGRVAMQGPHPSCNLQAINNTERSNLVLGFAEQ